MKGGRVLQQTSPEAATQKLQGQIWTQPIEREELAPMQQIYTVLSSHYKRDNTLYIRVHSSEKPGSNFTPAEPNLEDAYFLALNNTPTTA